MTLNLSSEPADAPVREAEQELAALRETMADGTADAAAYARFGGTLAQSGDLAGAERAWRKAAEMEPGVATYRTRLAQVLHRQGRREEAVTLLRQAAANGGADAGSYGLLGQILADAKDLPGAEEAFRKAVELNPKALAFRKSLAGVLNRRGMSEQAADLLRPAVEDGSADPGTCILLGHSLARFGDLAGAEQAIRRAIELNPSECKLRVELAGMLHRQGRLDEALAILHELAAASTTDADSLHQVARMLSLRFGDRAYGELLARKAVELDPSEPEFRFTLADLLIRRKEQLEALTIAWELRAEGIRYGKAFELWERAISKIGGLFTADQKLQRALQSNPADSTLHGTLAEVLHEQGRSDDAITVLLSHIEDGTEDARIFATLGRVRAARGNAEGAAQALRKAIEIDPTVKGYHEALAELAQRVPSASEALAASANSPGGDKEPEARFRDGPPRRNLRTALLRFSARLAAIMRKAPSPRG